MKKSVAEGLALIVGPFCWDQGILSCFPQISPGQKLLILVVDKPPHFWYTGDASPEGPVSI